MSDLNQWIRLLVIPVTKSSIYSVSLCGNLGVKNFVDEELKLLYSFKLRLLYSWQRLTTIHFSPCMAYLNMSTQTTTFQCSSTLTFSEQLILHMYIPIHGLLCSKIQTIYRTLNDETTTSGTNFRRLEHRPSIEINTI